MSLNFKQWAKVEFTKDAEKQLLETERKPGQCSVTEVKESFSRTRGQILIGQRDKTKKCILNLYIEFGNKRITGYLDENNLNGMLGSEAI